MQKYIVSILIIVLALLCLPLELGRIFNAKLIFPGGVVGTDFTVMAYIGLGVSLIFYQNFKNIQGRYLLIFSGIGIIILAIQVFLFSLTFEQFSNALALLTMVCAGFVCSKPLKRYLPLAFAILSIIAVSISLIEGFFNSPPYGITGNWNWSWSFIAISLPFLSIFFKKQYQFKVAVALIIVGLLLPFIFANFTSGALVFAIILSVLILLSANVELKYRRIAITSLLICFIIFTIVAMILLQNMPTFQVRSGLYSGTLLMLLENPVFGIGSGRYVAMIAPFIPSVYHASGLGAELHTHPHNELLFYWSTFGLFGVVYMAYYVCSIFISIYKYNQKKDLLLKFAWLVLFIHGILDPVLYSTLTGGFFLLLTGMFLNTKDKYNFKFNNLKYIGIIVLIFPLILIYQNLQASSLYRRALIAIERGDLYSGEKMLDKSASIRPQAQTIYAQAKFQFYKRKNPHKVLKHLQELLEVANMSSYGHSSGLRARALGALGMNKEALIFFDLEQKSFPQSAINAFYHWQVLNRLNAPEETQRVYNYYKQLMRQKKLPLSDIKKLINTPELDL